MQRHLATLLLTLTSLAFAIPAGAQQAPEGVSPNEIISATIGGDFRTGSRVTIVYGRPYSRHPQTGEMRSIWGGVVPWGEPWRLGADEATLLLAEHTLVIGEVTIPPGAYTLYMVPSESGTSQLAFSRKIGGWGIPVNVDSDVARVDLARSTLPRAVDQLTIAIDSVPPSGGLIRIMWESTQFALPFQVRR
jgi:hypothetical protein